MSVHLLANGRWKVRWRDDAVLDANGKPRSKSKTFDKKRDADAFHGKVALAKANDDVLPHSVGAEALTFGQLADQWCAHNSGWSKSTRTGYEGMLTNHLKPLIGGVVVRKMAAQQVMNLKSQLEKKDATATLVRKCMSVTRTILNHGILTGALTNNPANVLDVRGVMPPAPRKGPVKVLTPEQVEDIRTKMLGQHTSHGERDALLVSLMGYAGLRPGEALGLIWSDLDGAKLTIQRSLADGEETVTKRERSDRTLTLWQPLLDDLAAWKETRSPKEGDPVIPGPNGGFWSKNYYDQWRDDRAWFRCGPEGQSPYILRHAHASLRLRAGADVVRVAKYMGHAVGTLLKVYAHAIAAFDDEDDAIDPVALIYAARGAAPQAATGDTSGLSDDERALVEARREEQAWDAAVGQVQTEVPA